MRLHESGEMYLEAIHVLKKKHSQIRAIDIVNYTGYTKPSVSRAMSILKKGEFITIDSSGYINLTQTGEEMAHHIYERHILLTDFLRHLGVSKKTATEDACKIEHHISAETFQKIKSYIENNSNK